MSNHDFLQKLKIAWVCWIQLENEERLPEFYKRMGFPISKN